MCNFVLKFTNLIVVVYTVYLISICHLINDKKIEKLLTKQLYYSSLI